jgi:hypothetical protein
MPVVESESLQPQLEIAQLTLEKALTEACGVDLREIDTGELIRIEETLATASQAAKEAVSVRLKLRSRRKARQQHPPSSPADSAPAITQRVFEDLRGKRWYVYATRPSVPTPERVALPESFRQGWLSFESADEMRRVAPIPEGWEELSIDDLRQLCHKAASTPKRIHSHDTAIVKPPNS